jgi:hypothetical protein
MDTTAEQFFFPFTVPANEPKRVKTKWQELKEMSERHEETGGLMPYYVAAILLDVHRSRIAQLVEQGVLRRWDFFGKPYVCVNDVAAFMNSERKGGRPVKDPPTTFKEAHRRVKEHLGK